MVVQPVDKHAQIAAQEAALEGPSYQGYRDDGPVEPAHGADSAYDVEDIGMAGRVSHPPPGTKRLTTYDFPSFGRKAK
jgi:hypothetical protein